MHFLRKFPQSQRPQKDASKPHVWVTCLAWASIFGFILNRSLQAIQRHWAFDSEFDLGVYNQVVWNTLQGRIFFYTSTGQPLSHLSNHADPILLLPAPLYLIHNGPETLLVLQASLIGLAAWPIFRLSFDMLGSAFAALSLLWAYLLFPGTAVVTLSDFHPPAMAFAFLVFAFYYLEKEKTFYFLLFSILAMACKEQVPLQVIFLGFYILWRQGKWVLGLGTIALGASWFFVVMYWVIPEHSVLGEHIFLNYYADFGQEPLEILLTVLTRPDLIIKNLWQPAKLIYIRDIFTPFGFFPLLGLPVLLIGTPSFAINMLSNNPAMHDASRGHYVADVTPWLAWATLFGLFYIATFLNRVLPQQRWPWVNILALLLCLSSLSWHRYWGHSPLALDRPEWTVTAHERLGQSLMQRIPQEAAIAAQSSLYAHLSHRRIAYVYPHIPDVDYIFLDVSKDSTPLHPYDHYRSIKALLEGNEFGLEAANDGLILLKRGAPRASLPDQFYDFARLSEAQPQYPLDLVFGESIQLLGYDLLDNPRRQETQIRFYWKALKTIEEPLRLYPFFINSENEIIEDTLLRPMINQIWYPPQRWQAGEIVFTQTLPWPLGPNWSLGVGILAGDDWTRWDQRLPVSLGDSSQILRRFESNTWVRLSSFKRQGRYLQEILPPDLDLQPSHLLEANLGDQMRLFGYDLDLNKETLDLTLYWEALDQISYDYTIFVHVINANGQIIAQADTQPWWEVPIPTTTWFRGEKLRHHHPITLPGDLPPGDYRLHAGVYYWQTLERLPHIEDGVAVNNFIDVGYFSVE